MITYGVSNCPLVVGLTKITGKLATWQKKGISLESKAYWAISRSKISSVLLGLFAGEKGARFVFFFGFSQFSIYRPIS